MNPAGVFLELFAKLNSKYQRGNKYICSPRGLASCVSARNMCRQKASEDHDVVNEVERIVEVVNSCHLRAREVSTTNIRHVCYIAITTATLSSRR